MKTNRAPIPPDLRRAIYAAADGRCHLCGRPVDPQDFHVDHIVPLAQGGEDTAENLAAAHPFCNLRKGARVPIFVQRASIPEVDDLVGQWFHRLNPDGSTLWQGQVVGRSGPHHLVVQLYEWVVGSATSRRLVTREAMTDPDLWWFYETSEAMTSSYENQLSHVDARIESEDIAEYLAGRRHLAEVTR